MDSYRTSALVVFLVLSLIIAYLVGGYRINRLEERVANLEERLTTVEDWKAAEEEGDLVEDETQDFGP